MSDDFTSEAAKNAKVLADLVIDNKTTTHLAVKIITKLLEGREHDSFFETMFEENMTFGQCPECKHENHWFIPEGDLNQMGWVTYQKDKRVKQHATFDDCEEFAEACPKKKVTP